MTQGMISKTLPDPVITHREPHVALKCPVILNPHPAQGTTFPVSQLGQPVPYLTFPPPHKKLSRCPSWRTVW